MTDPMIPVDVICVCGANGSIRPLRLQMEDSDQGRIRVDIDQILRIKEIPYVGVEASIFLCRGRSEKRQHLFELKYTFRSHSWCLLRKVY